MFLKLITFSYLFQILISSTTGASIAEEILGLNSAEEEFVSTPFLIFRENKAGIDQSTWNVDAIVATEGLPASKAISFTVDDKVLPAATLYAEEKASNVKSKKFFKASFSFPRKPEQYSVTYSLMVDGKKIPPMVITIPGLAQELRLIATSCNGFHEPANEKLIGPREVMWEEIFNQHTKNQNHLMIGLGDQLYCDEIFNLPELQSWLSKKFSLEEFCSEKPTNETISAIDQYYFSYYLECFSKNTPSFSKCLSSIPQMNIWDDHDIFDGFGSLPTLLQNSPMIQAIGNAAKKYYLLFQHGIRPDPTTENAVKLGYLSNTNYSFFKVVGNTTFMAMDTRSERSVKNTMSPNSFTKFLKGVRKHISSSTKHLVVLSGVPIIHPDQSLLYDFVRLFADPYSCQSSAGRSFSQWLGTKFGILNVTGNGFTGAGPDTWGSHPDEKATLIAILKEISLSSNVRTTILTGDSHCAGIAKTGNKEKEQIDAKDSCLVQLLTSPVGNIPAEISSKALVKYMEYKASGSNASRKSDEKFLAWQDDESAPRFIQRRNWLQLTVTPDGNMITELKTEIPNSTPPKFEFFKRIVPAIFNPGSDSE